MGTPEQHTKIDLLKSQGYEWDRHLSASSAAVVMKKGSDIWVMTLDGGIHHNPESITVQL